MTPTILWTIFATVLVCVGLILIAWVKVFVLNPRRAAAPAVAPADLPSGGPLSYPSIVNLIFGAAFDFFTAYIAIALIEIWLHVRTPLWSQLLLAFAVGALKYAWSTNLMGNRVTTYHMGVVTFLQGIVDSGPDGKGLRPGTYWFPLGWPFYQLENNQEVKEISVPFENLQVWTKNTTAGGQGSIQAVLDGLAQFVIENPAEYNNVEHPFEVLEGLTHEAARDVAEDLTAEDYLDKKNKELGDKIFDDIDAKLAARTQSLGVRCVSVSVKKTDNKDERVKDGWAQITVQRALAESRRIDAEARVVRLGDYRAAGVDPNRAIAADLVADDKAGATVDDKRYNADIGDSLKEVGTLIANGIVNRIGGR
jgi:SPFH domain / Band 7 family